MRHPKCLDNNDDINLAMLQIRSTQKGTGLPSPAMLSFKKPIRTLLSQIETQLTLILIMNTI